MAHVSPTPSRSSGLPVLAFVVIGLAFGLWAMNAGPTVRSHALDADVEPVVMSHSYVGRYGGSEQVYGRIANTSDCGVLRRDVELMTDQQEGATPGSVEFNWTVGYMAAASDRMNAIGCMGS